MTISLWVKWEAITDDAHLFDFGNGADNIKIKNDQDEHAAARAHAGHSAATTKTVEASNYIDTLLTSCLRRIQTTTTTRGRLALLHRRRLEPSSAKRTGRTTSRATSSVDGHLAVAPLRPPRSSASLRLVRTMLLLGPALPLNRPHRPQWPSVRCRDFQSLHDPPIPADLQLRRPLLPTDRHADNAASPRRPRASPSPQGFKFVASLWIFRWCACTS